MARNVSREHPYSGTSEDASHIVRLTYVSTLMIYDPHEKVNLLTLYIYKPVKGINKVPLYTAV